MTAEDLKRFAGREWAAAEASKRDYWMEQYQQHGAAPARAAAAALALHMRRVQPGYPSAHDRDDDLTHHDALRQRLDRAAHAFTSR